MINSIQVIKYCARIQIYLNSINNLTAIIPLDINGSSSVANSDISDELDLFKPITDHLKLFGEGAFTNKAMDLIDEEVARYKVILDKYRETEELN